MMSKTIINSLLIGCALSLSSLSALAKEDSLIVAGGCFWCVESDFEKLAGVKKAVSGYTGGTTEHPSYEQVSSKKTGHFEAVKVTFDDEKISLNELVDYFWHTIDPTDPYGQFCDKGSPYKTALFYQNERQKNLFIQAKQQIEKNKPFAAPIVTEVLPAKAFWKAEDYHQNYAKINPVRYSYYRYSCGRDARVQELWGKVVSKH